MKIKNRNIARFLIASLVLASSCTGFSKTGRDSLIARAKEESKKEETIPTPNTIVKDVEPIIEDIDDIVTPKEAKDIEKL